MLRGKGGGPTFAALFHQNRYTMQVRLIALMLFVQCFSACLQDTEMVQSLLTSSFNNQHREVAKSQPTATGLVFQSSDGGQNWQDVSDGLPGKTRVMTAVADNGPLLLSSDKGIFRSIMPPAARMWEPESFPQKEVLGFYPGQSGLYANSFGTIYFRSNAVDNFWSAACQNLDGISIHTFLEAPDGSLFVGGYEGLRKSADGGNTWKTVFNKGIVNSIAVSENILIAGGPGGFLRSVDKGETWERVTTEFGGIATIKRLGNRLVAITQGNLSCRDMVQPESMGNRLIVSGDEGLSWQRMDESLSTLPFSYAALEEKSSHWFVNDIVEIEGKLFCSFGGSIFRSPDSGKTWEPVFKSDNDMSQLQLVVSGKTLYVIVGSGC
jgi:photosystem II stability/assembly factor-like uncharacterized protein